LWVQQSHTSVDRRSRCCGDAFALLTFGDFSHFHIVIFGVLPIFQIHPIFGPSM
jgi:hypothetical protein